MSKMVLILNGSPRKNGNTSVLINAFTEGTESVGNSVTRFDLQGMNINPCIGCGRGKDDENLCSQIDDMQKIYHAFRKADTIVFATPLYGWGMSAQLKTSIDRLAAILEARILDTKEVALLVAAGADYEENFAPLVQHYKAMANNVAWIANDKGMVLAGGVAQIGDIIGKPSLEEARKLGATI